MEDSSVETKTSFYCMKLLHSLTFIVAMWKGAGVPKIGKITVSYFLSVKLINRVKMLTIINCYQKISFKIRQNKD